MDSNIFVIYTESNLDNGDEIQLKYSLNHLIQMDANFLNDKVFKIVTTDDVSEANVHKFKYFNVKCQKVNDDSSFTVMEISDVNEHIERQ